MTDRTAAHGHFWARGEQHLAEQIAGEEAVLAKPPDPCIVVKENPRTARTVGGLISRKDNANDAKIPHKACPVNR